MSLIYQFFTEQKEYPLGNTANGQRFVDVDLVKIASIGDKNAQIVHEVENYRGIQKRMKDNGMLTKQEFDRFNYEYDLFKQGTPRGFEGTPLSNISVFSKADIANLNSYSIFSVEQLRDIPDSALHNLGNGMVQYKQKAELYFKQMTDDNAIVKAIAINNNLVAENEEMKKQISELVAFKNSQLQEAKAKGK